MYLVVKNIKHVNQVNKIIYTVEELHFCTFKTPTYRRFMGAKVGSLCAFEMRKMCYFNSLIARYQ